jgi:hypothetical protein
MKQPASPDQAIRLKNLRQQKFRLMTMANRERKATGNEGYIALDSEGEYVRPVNSPGNSGEIAMDDELNKYQQAYGLQLPAA